MFDWKLKYRLYRYKWNQRLTVQNIKFQINWIQQILQSNIFNFYNMFLSILTSTHNHPSIVIDIKCLNKTYITVMKFSYSATWVKHCYRYLNICIAFKKYEWFKYFKIIIFKQYVYKRYFGIFLKESKQ